jgi:hypothetical protein
MLVASTRQAAAIPTGPLVGGFGEAFGNVATTGRNLLMGEGFEFKFI